MDIEPLYAQPPLTANAKLKSSHNQEEIWKVTDHDATTSWDANTGNDDQVIWIEVEFDQPVVIAGLSLGRGEEWRSPRNNPELQVPDGKGDWVTVFQWKQKWEPVKFLDEPVTTDRARLKVTGTSRFHLAEFELFSQFQ
jgi:hypothetical protein